MRLGCYRCAGCVRAALAALPLLAAAAQTIARDPLELIPAESLLCWSGRPAPDAARAESRPSTLQTLLELGGRVAGQSLDNETQLNIRIAEMFGLMIRYRHAVALIDARAKALEYAPEAQRVDQLRFVAVVENREEVEPFLRIIQKAVDEQTDRGAATLTSRKAGRWTYQELRDQRLPEWATIAWGRMEGNFVLTVGADVWPQIATVAQGEAPSLAQDRWYAAARQDVSGTRAGEPPPLIEIFVAAEAIQKRLDPFVEGKASAFFKAWDAGGLQHAHWVIGYVGRALYCRAHFGTAGKTAQRVYADANARDARLLGTIPPEARYAIWELPVGRFLPRLCRGWLAVQGEKPRANIERIWGEIQAEQGFDVERDFLAHLGGHVVLHNDPPHPLRLPFAVTILIEIRDEPATVRRTLDTMCAGWRAALTKVGADGKSGAPCTLEHDDDGVWYVRFDVAGSGALSLAGPAWVMTDRFIIVSWSPMALREYLDEVGDRVK